MDTKEHLRSDRTAAGGNVRLSRILIIAVQVILAIGLLSGILVSMQGNTSQTLALPERLAGMRLVQRLEGKDAVSQMNQLHGTDVGVIDGHIADYADGSRQRLTVWVGKTKSEADAAALLRIMTDKIGAGNPVFTGLQRLTIEGKTVFSVKSGDGSHYYYQSRDAVVWLSVLSPEPLPIATEAMRTF